MTAPQDMASNAPLDNNGQTPRRHALDWQHWLEWPTRIFFGVLLAGFAIAATIAGGFYFAGFLALVAIAASREWHRMIGRAQYGREIVITAVAIVGALALFVLQSQTLWPWALIVAGSALAAISALMRRVSPLWDGAGAFYVGIPVLCALALRIAAPNGMWVAIALFLIVWTADTGALLTGRLIGGPKIVPVLSPNKTWAGFIGGLALPAVVMGGYVAWLGGNVTGGAILGAGLAFVGHAGDLFESWLKRRVGRKNSGSLIPGHGGVLDRIDSALLVAPAAAVLIFLIGLDPLFGAHP